jgi:lipooligosaccharide transport system permease protein
VTVDPRRSDPPAAGQDRPAAGPDRPAAGPDPTGISAPPGRMVDRAWSSWWVTYRRTWRGTLWSSFLSPLLYLAAMGYGLGSLVDSSTPGGLGGVPYVVYVAPGVLAAVAMQTAIGESSYPVMGAIRWQRQYHAMLATPLGVTDVLLGHLLFVLFRVTTTAAVFLAVAAALGAVRSWWSLLAVPVAALCGLAFAAPTFAYAASQEGDQGFTVLFRFVMVPLFLFSGTFFPVSQLPAAVQAVATVTPLFHAVEACRALALGRADVLGVLAHVLVLVLWSAAGLWLARRVFTAKLVR